MRALVVFESMFGNTEKVARAVARGLAATAEVEVVDVAAAPASLEGVDLLVVGAPTHAFGLSRPGTRADAGRQGAAADASSAGGLREWLDAVRLADGTPLAAAFDTRVDRPRVPGSAARAAARRLGRLGCRVVVPAASFYVLGVAGPPVDGEEARAERWAQGFAAAAPAPSVSGR